MKKMASKKIIVDNRVVFTPTRRELIDHRTNCQVRLQTPASRCLELLIDKQGEVVAQEELMICGWGEKRKNTITSNTYYQCILQMRKALSKVGLQNAVITIPRVGLKINTDLTFHCSDVDSIADDPAEAFNSKHITPSDTCLKCEMSTRIQKKTVLSKTIVFFYPICTFIIFFLSTLFMLFLFRGHAFQNQNQKYEEIQNGLCKTYVSDVKITQEELRSVFARAGITCSKGNIVMAETSAVNTRVNILYCTRYNLINQNCKALVFLKGAKKNEI